MISVTSQPERVKQINDLSTTKSGKNFSITFQGKLQYLDISVVGIQFPLYRLTNGRTQTAQQEYLLKTI